MRFDATGSVDQLKSWARAVVEEQFVATELKEAWAPSDKWGVRNSVSTLFDPIVRAMERSWTVDELTKVASAMKAATWHAGQCDELDWQRLRDYFKAKPSASTTRQTSPTQQSLPVHIVLQ